MRDGFVAFAFDQLKDRPVAGRIMVNFQTLARQLRSPEFSVGFLESRTTDARRLCRLRLRSTQRSAGRWSHNGQLSNPCAPAQISRIFCRISGIENNGCETALSPSPSINSKIGRSLVA